MSHTKNCRAIEGDVCALHAAAPAPQYLFRTWNGVLDDANQVDTKDCPDVLQRIAPQTTSSGNQHYYYYHPLHPRKGKSESGTLI